MDIYERLITDHDRQRDLCAELAETHGDHAERRLSWKELKSELEAHALAEEQTFYAELMEHPNGTEKARHSVAEHKGMADLVEELEKTDMTSGAWLTTFKKLAHCVNHHLDEEEEEVFVLARKILSKATAEKLAAKFNERKPAELREHSA